MRSLSDASEPTFVFSVLEGDTDTFYCVIFKRAHPAHQLQVLEQVLAKLSVMHVSKNVKTNTMPLNLALPQIDPKTVNEILRKGAGDTKMLLKQAGAAASLAFLAAAEMHKKCAPKPAGQPVQASPDVRDQIGRTRQAAAAGAAVATGVAAGMQAATVEISGALMRTVSSAAGNREGACRSSSGGGGFPQPLEAVGGIGMELLRVSPRT
ncbi:hypothetical protein COO60DRAFT_774588 [Scenedesmus sp. NREL 46B-D3]|nr:hypothetical protein COO60DRAFT_774588 [Scenedesmus sp. NREL 46B-D3]